MRSLRAGPNRRAAIRRCAAALVAVAVLSVAASTHRRGLEMAERWGATTEVLVLDAPVSAGDALEGRTRVVRAPAGLLPDGHVRALPSGAVATVDLGEGEILTRRRLQDDESTSGRGPAHRRTLVPVPLRGNDGTAPAELAPGDVVDVIGPGAATAAGGRDRARTVAAGALVRSLDAGAVTLEVAARDVAPLADAVLGGPVVLTVVGTASDRSGPGGGHVVDDE